MNVKDRIVGLRRIRASELRPNPANWRKHPQGQQAALRGILAEVGYVDALIAIERDGGYMLLDGHLRAETTPDAEVPVLVVDLSDAEAAKVLATFDPLSAMAEVDSAKLDALLREVDTGSAALQEMLAELASDASAAAVADMAANAEPEAEEDAAQDGYVTFAVPLSADQEQIVRQVLRKARVKFGCDSTGKALAAALNEWSQSLDGTAVAAYDGGAVGGGTPTAPKHKPDRRRVK